MSLKDRILKTSIINETAMLDKSKLFSERDMVTTPVPMINVALSASLRGGLTPGLTIWAGESKRFKTLFSLFLAKTYLDHYPDAILLFYDSEFGTPRAYWDSLGIPQDRVVHSPIVNIEVLKFDIMKQLEALERGDKLVIVVDSLGNLASKKEVEDAKEEKSVADMSRAKQIKSLFRMVTPQLTLKNIPMIVVNHIYMTQGMYPTAVVSGGSGPYLSADNIYIIGRQQIKEGTEIAGYDFIINVDKSRFVREKSKIPITVSFDSGLSRWSGLLPVALESGHVTKPSNGWYQRWDDETKKYRIKELDNEVFWTPVLEDPAFEKFITDKYAIGNESLIRVNDILVDEDGVIQDE